MSENQQKKPDLGLLEEDDEFEEFPAEGLGNLHNTAWINAQDALCMSCWYDAAGPKQTLCL